jgi:hypothetical protein
MLKFMNKLRGHLAGQQLSDVEKREQLIVSVADEKPVKEADAAALMERLQKTTDDLEQAVKALGKRRKLRAQIEAANAADAELERIQRECVAADEAFTPIQEKYQTEIEGLSNSQQYWKQMKVVAREATDGLIESCIDSRALGEYQAACREEEKVQERLSQCYAAVKQCEDIVGMTRTGIDKVKPMRQIEIAEQACAMHTFATGFVKCLAHRSSLTALPLDFGSLFRSGRKSENASSSRLWPRFDSRRSGSTLPFVKRMEADGSRALPCEELINSVEFGKFIERAPPNLLSHHGFITLREIIFCTVVKRFRSNLRAGSQQALLHLTCMITVVTAQNPGKNAT